MIAPIFVGYGKEPKGCIPVFATDGYVRVAVERHGTYTDADVVRSLVTGGSRTSRPWTSWAGVVATLAAAFASAGDLLLLAVANGITPALFRGESALVVGYYLGVLAIPLYAVGYWAVSRGLPSSYRRPLLALGTCGAVVGGTIHGVTGAALHAGTVARVAAASADGGADLLMPFTAYLLPLWLTVAAALLFGSVLFAVAILRGGTAYPRWMALVNPAGLIVAIAACASVAPWSRALLVPASPNLAHLIFFALATTYGAVSAR